MWNIKKKFLIFFFSFKHNNIEKTKVVITDKDFSEIRAVEEVFIHAEVFLCLFHVLAAVDKRLTEAKLPRDLRHEIYEEFKKAVYADSEEVIDGAKTYLCALGSRFFF